MCPTRFPSRFLSVAPRQDERRAWGSPRHALGSRTRRACLPGSPRPSKWDTGGADSGLALGVLRARLLARLAQGPAVQAAHAALRKQEVLPAASEVLLAPARPADPAAQPALIPFPSASPAADPRPLVSPPPPVTPPHLHTPTPGNLSSSSAPSGPSRDHRPGPSQAEMDTRMLPAHVSIVLQEPITSCPSTGPEFSGSQTALPCSSWTVPDTHTRLSENTSTRTSPSSATSPVLVPRPSDGCS